MFTRQIFILGKGVTCLESNKKERPNEARSTDLFCGYN